MVRNLMSLGLTALLLTAFSAPVRAVEPTESAKIDAIYKRILLIQEQDIRLKNAEGDLKDLRRRVDELEAQLRTREDTDRNIRRSFSPSNLSGSIRLENRTALPATIMVDGLPYPLAPFEMRSLPPRPAGTISYEVFVEGWGVRQPLTTRTLAAERPFTVYIYNP